MNQNGSKWHTFLKDTHYYVWISYLSILKAGK